MKRTNDLAHMYDNMKIQPHLAAVGVSIVNTIKVHAKRYQAVSKLTNVPWQIISSIHWMEGSGNFATHLHNGDSLKARTWRVPKGRPRVGNPPFTWEQSAIDALEYDGLTKHPWGKDRNADLLKIELFNGPGYLNRKINSPYLWSGSNWYDMGKFVSDGKFSSTAVSKQFGAACILKGLGW